MKFILLILLVVSTFSKVEYRYDSKYNSKSKLRLKSHSRSHSRSRSHSKSSMTPKGTQLTDHYGANPYSNVYGPRMELINREAFIKNPDGSVARKRIRILNNAAFTSSQCDIT